MTPQLDRLEPARKVRRRYHRWCADHLPRHLRAQPGSLDSDPPPESDGALEASIEKNVNRKIVTRYKRKWLLFLDIPSRIPDNGAVAEIVVL